MKEDRQRYNVWLPLALSVMLALGMVFGYTMNDKEQNPLIQRVQKDIAKSPAFGQVEELIRFVESRYVDSIDRQALVEAGIREVLSKLDPHSIYISPDELQGINDDMKGSFQGIGVEVFYLEDTINIIRTIEDGPAAKAGLQPFDKILYINNELVAGQDSLTYDMIRNRLRGELGEKLNLKVKRIGNADLVPLEVVVDNIAVSSIDAGFMATDQVGYIKISKFTSKTYKEFMEHFEKFQDEGMKDLIIDLRGNPGGYLPEATNILSQLFREKGNMLVYTEGKNDKKQEYKTTGKPFFQVEDIAVLIDENSASGSEIIAGAIQDWDRGIVIGRRSFGKGLVQEQYDLSNGGALRLTVARYYTPSGRSIQREYADLKSYYHDRQDRLNSGELFHDQDSKDEDSLMYETKNLGRSVYGGGGITPDVFIAADSLYYEDDMADILNRLSQDVYKILRKDKTIPSDQIQSYILNNLNKKYVLSDEQKDIIRREIKTDYVKLISGKAAMYEHMLKQDEAYSAALDYFNGEISLKSIYAKNE